MQPLRAVFKHKLCPKGHKPPRKHPTRRPNPKKAQTASNRSEVWCHTLTAKPQSVPDTATTPNLVPHFDPKGKVCSKRNHPQIRSQTLPRRPKSAQPDTPQKTSNPEKPNKTNPITHSTAILQPTNQHPRPKNPKICAIGEICGKNRLLNLLSGPSNK